MPEEVQLKFLNKDFSIPVSRLLLIFFVAAICLRLPNLDGTGLWMDEIHSAIGTDPDKKIEEVLEYCIQDQPPVFFILLHGWFKILPYNDLSGRLIVVLTGALGVLSIYFLGKEYKDRTVGLMASFITLLNYFHIDFSRQMRFYPLVFLLATLSFLFYFRIFKRQSVSSFIFYILATAALLNTHYFGMVVFGSQFILFLIIIIWKKISDIKFISFSLLSGLLTGLSFVHWLPVVISDLGIPSFHAEQVKWYFPLQYHWVYFRDIITCSIIGLFLFLSVRKIYVKTVSRSIEVGDLILLGWIMLGFLVPLIYSLVRMPMMEYKYSFIVLPGIFILAAAGFAHIGSARIRVSLIVVLFLSFLINSLLINKLYFRKPFEAWRDVTKEIMTTYSDREIVFSEYAWYYRYYFKVFNLPGQPFEPRYSDFKALTNQFNAVWILKQTKYPDQGLSAEQLQYLEDHFKLAKEWTFVDTHARYYVRR